MAEAHQAVAFSFAITHEGWNVNYDREVLNLVYESGKRSWRKRLARIKAGIKNGAYPAHLESLWVIMVSGKFLIHFFLIILIIILFLQISVTLLHFLSKRVPYDLVNVYMNVMPGYVPKKKFKFFYTIFKS